jgi:hypothetical protein
MGRGQNKTLFPSREEGSSENRRTLLIFPRAALRRAGFGTWSLRMPSEPVAVVSAGQNPRPLSMSHPFKSTDADKMISGEIAVNGFFPRFGSGILAQTHGASGNAASLPSSHVFVRGALRTRDRARPQTRLAAPFFPAAALSPLHSILANRPVAPTVNSWNCPTRSA